MFQRPSSTWCVPTEGCIAKPDVMGGSDEVTSTRRDDLSLGMNREHDGCCCSLLRPFCCDRAQFAARGVAVFMDLWLLL